jgi:hypothetical protein
MHGAKVTMACSRLLKALHLLVPVCRPLLALRSDFYERLGRMLAISSFHKQRFGRHSGALLLIDVGFDTHHCPLCLFLLQS